MEVIEKTIPYKWGDVFKIFPPGDLHSGTKHCAEDLVRAKVKEISSDPLALWVGMGDLAECITPGDKRWDWGVISNWVDPDNIAHCQQKRVCHIFRPIVSQGLGLIRGNHENSIRLRNHVDIQSNICEELGLRDLGHSCFVKLNFKRKRSTEAHSFLCVFTHGSGGAITRGAKINRLERFMDNFNARIYAHAHVHDVITDTKPYLDLAANKEIVARQKVGAMTGSWFTSYTQGVPPSYAEQKNYPPSVLGCPVFYINPGENTVRVEG